MSEYKTLTIKMAAELHDDLHAMADDRGITVSELIRRAIALDKFVWENRNSGQASVDGDHLRQIAPT